MSTSNSPPSYGDPAGPGKVARQEKILDSLGVKVIAPRFSFERSAICRGLLALQPKTAPTLIRTAVGLTDLLFYPLCRHLHARGRYLMISWISRETRYRRLQAMLTEVPFGPPCFLAIDMMGCRLIRKAGRTARVGGVQKILKRASC